MCDDVMSNKSLRGFSGVKSQLLDRLCPSPTLKF